MQVADPAQQRRGAPRGSLRGRVGAALSAAFIASTALVVAPAAAAPAATAQEAEPTTGDRPVSITPSQLDAALTCSGDLAGATVNPVLLTPAFSTGSQSYGWNYARSLPKAGFPTCVLSLPDRGYGDLQVAAEYVVAATRQMHERSGRQIALVGHQHGALNEVWALQNWPDLPAMVSDVVSMATPYKGTALAAAVCTAVRACPPAVWQIRTNSAFLRSIAAKGLPAGPSYTSIYTRFDELIVPQPKASTLDGGTTIAVQDICPLRPVEHFTILGDDVTYRLVIDALTHPGPASRTRVPRTACLRLTAPEVLDSAGAVRILYAAAGAITGAATNVPVTLVGREPAIR